MDTTLVISILLGVMTFTLITVFLGINVFEGTSRLFLDIFETIIDHIGDFNTKRYIERVKREKIVIRKENVIAKYNRLVEGIIIDFNMPLTLESFTSLLCIFFAITVLLIVLFMQNITLSVVMAVSIFIGILTLFVMQSKAIKAQRLEDVMDAEDIICPLAREGVFVAIKKVLEGEEYLNPNVRPYFQQFVYNCENNGYSFRQAITLLNKQLGPKFDNFTKKAITFEYNERKGMADVFLDIVDENAVLREINLRKDRIFRKMNRDFLMKTALITGFFLYALSVPEFKEFMINNDLGKLINTVLISIICVSFARCQMLQGDLGAGGTNE